MPTTARKLPVILYVDSLSDQEAKNIILTTKDDEVDAELIRLGLRLTARSIESRNDCIVYCTSYIQRNKRLIAYYKYIDSSTRELRNQEGDNVSDHSTRFILSCIDDIV